MLEAQRPFTVAQLVEQARLLNAFLFQAIPAAVTTAAVAPGRTPAASVAERPWLWDLLKRLCAWLRLLRARDEARPFCPPDLWPLVRPNKAAAFQDALLSGAPGPAAVLHWLPWTVPFSVRLQVFRTTVRIHTGGRRGDDDDWEAYPEPSLAQMLRTLWSALRPSRRPTGSPSAAASAAATASVPAAPLLFPLPAPAPLPAAAPTPRRRAGPTVLQIRRARLLEDAVRTVNALPPSVWQGPVRIRFVNAEGVAEAGIDQRGLFKEFLEETTKALTRPALGLFEATPLRTLMPTPEVRRTAAAMATAAAAPGASASPLPLYTLLGRLLGKAVREDVVLDVPLAPVFLATLQGARGTLTDLATVDPDLYRNLLFVKSYEGSMDDLALTFSVDHEVPAPGTTLPAPRHRGIRPARAAWC